MNKTLKIISMLFVISTVIYAAGCAEKTAMTEEEASEQVAEETVVAEENVTEVNVTEEDVGSLYLSKYKQSAQLIFKPSEKMKVGETEIIKAYITKNTSEKVPKILEENNTLQSENITITPKMKVRLVGEDGSAFIINPITDETQPIIGEEVTTWKWQVTPQKTGKQALILCFDYIIESSSGTASLSIPSEQKENIYVEVNPYYFVESHWQSIIATVATITAILSIPWAGKILKRKNDKT